MQADISPSPDPDRDADRVRLVGRGWRLRAIAVVALSVAFVAVAVAGRLTGQQPSPLATQVAPGPRVALATQAAFAASAAPAAVTDEPTPRPRPLPGQIDCQGLDRPQCLAITAAAVGQLPSDLPDVVSVTVWQSLLCDSDIECPPGRLLESVPLGSADVAFADGGPSALLNVVTWRTGVDPSVALHPYAWIVRWVQPPAPTPAPSRAATVRPSQRHPPRRR